MKGRRPLVLVGGVGQLYQGDLDAGRRAVDRLAGEDLPGAVVEDLHYGAVAVAQRLQDLRPEVVVLVGAEQRDRVPGCVERRLIDPPRRPATEASAFVADAVTGHVSIDLVIEVAAALGALPGRCVTIEIEPATTEPTSELSAAAAAALERALDLVRREVRWAPVLELAGLVRQRLAGLPEGRTVAAARRLADELVRADRQGHAGASFLAAEQLRLVLGAQDVPGIEKLDWGLWWGLIEELQRLQQTEGSSPSG